MLTNDRLSADCKRTDNRKSGQGGFYDLRVSRRCEYCLLLDALRT